MIPESVLKRNQISFKFTEKPRVNPDRDQEKKKEAAP